MRPASQRIVASGCRPATVAFALVLLAGVPASVSAQAIDEDNAGALAAVARTEARVVTTIRRDVLTNLEAQRIAATSLARQASELASLVRAQGTGDVSPEGAQSASRLLATSQATFSDTARQLEHLITDIRYLLVQYDLASQRSNDLARAAAEDRRRRPGDDEPLTGEWEVTMGPMNDRGTFRIRQTGTLLNGDYELSSGRRGSLQGTLVGDRVQLEPIDARAGRDMTLFGTVTPAFDAIEGSWEARVFGAGRPGFGKWTGRKKALPASEPADTISEAEEQP